MEQWLLIEWDFEHTLHRDASREIFEQTWRWFKVRVAGLLSQQGTALNAFFHPAEPTTPEGAPDGG